WSPPAGAGLPSSPSPAAWPCSWGTWAALPRCTPRTPGTMPPWRTWSSSTMSCSSISTWSRGPDTARDPAAGRSVETPMTPWDAKPASELKASEMGHDPERQPPWGEQEKA
ncbi:unnamed protein product, partial [Lepidochelys kempii]